MWRWFELKRWTNPTMAKEPLSDLSMYYVEKSMCIQNCMKPKKETQENEETD